MNEEINWPVRPESLKRKDGIDWHITFVAKQNGGLMLVCNSQPFCVIKPARKQPNMWTVPGEPFLVQGKLRAMQTAARNYLGKEAQHCTLVSA